MCIRDSLWVALKGSASPSLQASGECPDNSSLATPSTAPIKTADPDAGRDFSLMTKPRSWLGGKQYRGFVACSRKPQPLCLPDSAGNRMAQPGQYRSVGRVC